MILKKIPLFSGLDDKELEKINRLVKIMDYPKGCFVFHEGELGEKTYFIKSGKVKIFKTSKNGKEQILGIKVKGDIFGEVTLLNPVRYPASAQALEDSWIGCISNCNLEIYIKNHPDVSLNLIKTLNKNLLEAQHKIKNLAVNDTYTRTVLELIELSQKFGVTTPEGIKINLVLTRQELAGMIGTTRETISRILAKLKQEETINIINKHIYIKDIEKLKNWL